MMVRVPDHNGIWQKVIFHLAEVLFNPIAIYVANSPLRELENQVLL